MATVVVTKQAEKSFLKLPYSSQKKISKAIDKLIQNPLSGEKLKGEFEGQYKIYAWPYRVIYIFSATELKNRVSEVLNDVAFGGNVAVIERYGKPVAKVVPIKENKSLSREETRKALDVTFGSIPDFPDVTKFRRSRKKSFSL